MIHGDIDLTENLDFYKDKKEKKYSNTKLSNHNEQRKYDYSFEFTSSSLTTTNRINNLYYSIPNQNGSSTLYFTYNSDTDDIIGNYNTTSTYDIWDIDNSSMYTTSYYINNISTSTQQKAWIGYNWKKETTISKLFGRKSEHTRSKATRLWNSQREEKEYVNIKDLLFGSKDDNSSINYLNVHFGRNWFHKRGGLFYTEYDEKPSRIFGHKEEKEPNIPIPWLNSNSRNRYEEYIRDLKEDDEDVYDYLTNYSWLRM